MRMATEADLFLAIGSSLQVYPAAGLVPAAAAAGARVVIVNAQPTAFDDVVDAVLREPIGEVLPRCGPRVRWITRMGSEMFPIVLVVDDDPGQVLLVTTFPKKAGFRVISAPSGVAALAALERRGRRAGGFRFW